MSAEPNEENDARGRYDEGQGDDHVWFYVVSYLYDRLSVTLLLFR